MKMIKINVIFVHGIEFSTFTEKLREIGDRPKFALPFLRGQPLKLREEPSNTLSGIVWGWNMVDLQLEIF